MLKVFNSSQTNYGCQSQVNLNSPYLPFSIELKHMLNMLNEMHMLDMLRDLKHMLKLFNLSRFMLEAKA